MAAEKPYFLVCPIPGNLEAKQLSIEEYDPVYTVPDPHGHDIKFDSSATDVALTLAIILQNLTTNSHRKKW